MRLHGCNNMSVLLLNRTDMLLRTAIKQFEVDDNNVCHPVILVSCLPRSDVSASAQTITTSLWMVLLMGFKSLQEYIFFSFQWVDN